MRIPSHPVIHSIMSQLDVPLLVTSVVSHNDHEPYFQEASSLISHFEKQVAFLVLDESYIQEESTVVELTTGEPVVLRQSRHIMV